VTVALVGRVRDLTACVGNCTPVVGGKAAGLGSLLRQGLRVPPGFAVTTDAYRDFVVRNGLDREIASLLASARSVEEQQHVVDQVRGLFESVPVPGSLSDEIAAAYRRLGREVDVPVAVRSSATAEDLAEASFAGQQDTYLWVVGAEEVVRHVVRCWASLFTPQAIAYRHHLGMDDIGELAMGVVVQMMVPAEAAGVMLTVDPVTGDPSQVSIEASFGLGAAVVNGEVTPDRVYVDKVTYDIRSRTVSPKAVAYRFEHAAGGVVVVEVPEAERTKPAITDDEAVALARLGRQIERAHGCFQDIEWAIGPGAESDREVFLLQARPEVTWNRKPRGPIAPAGTTVMDRMLAALTTKQGRAGRGQGTP
jgi:phosphoenolpyruvate synthase/pyruvate phosphate dikinase